jgi:mRNA-degrading endonuclease RelE of RelBE toxin-antitoxin system
VIRDIQEFPYSYKVLAGQLVGTRSARIGDFRIIYAIDVKEKRIILLHVGQRERVYER